VERQPSVDAQSALAAKFPIFVVPSAIAANIAARCDIDLSPGMVNRPLRLLALVIFIQQN
jgi:hypothetical protein